MVKESIGCVRCRLHNEVVVLERTDRRAVGEHTIVFVGKGNRNLDLLSFTHQLFSCCFTYSKIQNEFQIQSNPKLQLTAAKAGAAYAAGA
jgi:hypothetical protein